MITHQVDGEMTVALIGVAAAAGFAALTTWSLPTGSGRTFWAFAALGVYASASLGGLVGAVVFGLSIRSVIEAARTTVSDAFERAGLGLFDIALGAFWLPLVALLWIFLPRGRLPGAKPG